MAANKIGRGLVYGWGILDADYPLHEKEYYGYTGEKQNVKVIWICPFYRKWTAVLERCFSESFQAKNPAYVGCFVNEDWKYFSNFKRWMEQQDWENNELDKDLLIKGNKEYGPSTCLFISEEINKFMVSSTRSKKDLPLGVHLRKDNGMYRATCSQLGAGHKSLGQYDNPEDAHLAWLTEKRRLAKLLSEKQTNPVVAEALLKYY